MVGERRVVTMLFCDVTGSTAAAERLDPEDWTEIINGAFERMIGPVYKFEGTLARLMGDAILAFFGAPIAHEDDAQRAVLAGLEILANLEPYREEVAGRFGIDFNVRVGINTGPVVVGAMGSDLRLEYTAMGDAVNLAARMEQTADPGTVQVAEDTYRLVRPLFDFEPLGGLQIKGKAEPVLAYRVAGRRSAPGPARGIEGLSAPLIGRGDEWQRLAAAVETVQKGVGQIVFLVGEAGLGKSRLIQELRAGADGNSRSGLAWLEAAPRSFEAARPYSLFQRLLRQVMGAAESDDTAVLRRRLDALLAGAPEEEREALAMVSETLLGLPSADGRPPLEGEAFKGRLYLAATHLWSRLAGERPTVLVIDDLHWSDPASAALLEHLLALSEQAPLLFLFASRPERESPGWALKARVEERYAHRYTEVNVRPLSAADSQKLVDSLLNVADLPSGLRSRIQEKAEGNPFFVEEVIRTLIESGAVTRSEDGDHWLATGPVESINIPGSLQTLLTARMDRLDEETRRILQLAALIGRSFYYRLLEHVVDGQLGQTAPRLDLELNKLQRADLIREAARLPELEYIFRHSLTQEAAYRTILRRERKAYHQRVGEAIEALYADRLLENAPALAHHFLAAGDRARAFRYSVMAGDEAFRLYALPEALAQYDRAVEAATGAGAGAEELIHLYTRRGRALELSPDYAAAEANYLELAELAEGRDDPSLKLAALNLRATVHAVISPLFEPSKALALADEALALARQLGDRRAQARAHWNRMLANGLSGMDGPAAIADGELSLAISRELGLREQMAYTLHDLGQGYMGSGRREEALAAAAEARELFRELNNLPMLATTYQEEMFVRLPTGDLDAAMAAVEEAYRISKAIGNTWNVHFALVTRAWIAVQQGDAGQTLMWLDEAAALSNESIASGQYIFAGMVQGQVYVNLGRPEEALTAAEQLLARAGSLPGPMGTLLSQASASIHLELGEIERVRSLVSTGAPAASPGFFMGVEAQLGLVRALYHSQVQPPELALPLVDGQVDWARSAGEGLILPRLLRLKGELLATMGQRQAALEALQEGLEVARRQGQRPDVQNILAAMIPLAEEPSEREALLAEGREVVAYLSDHAGSEELRQSYLALPAVRLLLT
jgi:predicted ATPase/class 3 adenylate cyclase